MKNDILSPLAIAIINILPKEPWRNEHKYYNLYLPFSIETDKSYEEIPGLYVQLDKQQFEYLQENRESVPKREIINYSVDAPFFEWAKFYDSSTNFTVEELYQAFKERLNNDIEKPPLFMPCSAE